MPLTMLGHLMLPSVCVVEAGVAVLVLSVVTKNSEFQENPVALHPALLQSDRVWTSC